MGEQFETVIFYLDKKNSLPKDTMQKSTLIIHFNASDAVIKLAESKLNSSRPYQNVSNSFQQITTSSAFTKNGVVLMQYIPSNSIIIF